MTEDLVDVEKEFDYKRKFKLEEFEVDQEIPKEQTKVVSKTCFIYDERMMAHKDNPEQPKRIYCIWEELKKQGINKKATRTSSQKVTIEQLYAVHTKTMVDDLIKSYSRYDDIFTLPCAFLASGSCVKMVEKVIKEDYDNGVVIIRPPGHHATKSEYGGFCYFNNVAVGAKYAIDKLGLKKVAIIDFDVHHGNGTQDIFEKDPQVLFISTHQYGNFYPGTGSVDEVGKDDGKGFTVNIPLKYAKYGDKEFLLLFTKIILPILIEYEPELIIVSAGFDAADGDPLGNMKITPNGYGMIISLLKSLGIKLVLALEGGYNLDVIPLCVAECFRVLLGESPKKSNQEEIEPLIYDEIKDVIQYQSLYWKSLQ